MKKFVALLVLSAPGITAINTSAQHTSPRADSILTGTWKGSSLCEQKDSPCHDESVVYHISKLPGNDTFYIQANKIVNGAEEDMGILSFLFNEKSNRLESKTHNAIWSFLLKGKELEGTLIFKGNLYRKIRVSKTL